MSKIIPLKSKIPQYPHFLSFDSDIGTINVFKLDGEFVADVDMDFEFRTGTLTEMEMELKKLNATFAGQDNDDI